MAISPARVEEILEGIYQAKTLKVIMPNPTELRAFFEYLSENAAADQRYMRAQQAKAEQLVDDIVEIADTELDAQKARNRIDARKWVASKMQPHKFGDRLDLNVTQTVDLSGALLEAQKRILLPRSYPEKITDAEIVETPKLTLARAADEPSVVPDPDDIFS